jgi:hypothetical protein
MGRGNPAWHRSTGLSVPVAGIIAPNGPGLAVRWPSRSGGRYGYLSPRSGAITDTAGLAVRWPSQSTAVPVPVPTVWAITGTMEGLAVSGRADSRVGTGTCHHGRYIDTTGIGGTQAEPSRGGNGTCHHGTGRTTNGRDWRQSRQSAAVSEPTFWSPTRPERFLKHQRGLPPHWRPSGIVSSGQR